MALKRNALGRGLDSLIRMDTTTDTESGGSTAINEISLDLIKPNPDQPRRDFDEEALSELASSIREHGIIQPLSLRKIDGSDSYEIIAGERRYRASRMAGLNAVPAYIREANDSEITEMALIENIQREDLNPVEIALTFQKLIDQYKLTQEQLSGRIGKKRATIANFLRLLRLPADIQLGLRDRRLDMGHARALLSLDDPSLQLKVYKRIIDEDLSVRKVEQIVKQLNSQTENDQPATPAFKPNFDLLTSHLSSRCGTKVNLSCDAKGNGKISFPFHSEDELERLIAIFDTINQSPT